VDEDPPGRRNFCKDLDEGKNDRVFWTALSIIDLDLETVFGNTRSEARLGDRSLHRGKIQVSKCAGGGMGEKLTDCTKRGTIL